MNRVSLCALIGVLCVYGAAAQSFCAPDQYNTGYSLIMNEVTEAGRFAVDFTTNQLAANASGFSNTAEWFNGSFVFNNGAGYWYDRVAKTCYKSQPPMQAFLTQCLKSDGVYTPITVGSIGATLYKYETTANATAITFTDYPSLPVSYQFFSFGGPGIPGEPGQAPWMQTITYFNTAQGVDPSQFDVPSYCQNSELKVKEFHELPIHKSIMGLLMAH